MNITAPLLAGISLTLGLAPRIIANPTPAEVLRAMERVADWQLANPSRWGPTEWHSATGYTGLMALACISPSPRFHDAMMKMGEGNAWKLGSRIYDADDHCVGQTYAELYLQHRDPKMIAALRERFDTILRHPKAQSLDFDQVRNPDRRDRWSWCDALFMGPPAWIRLWAATGDRAYLDFMIDQWWQTSDYLYDKEAHLFFRDDRYFTQRSTNGEKIFWSRGNGWVIGGLVRVLQFLPAGHPARPRFVTQFRGMAEKLASCQQPDGLWRASLLDPVNFPRKETSGSGFHCYALAWGVNEGVLDQKRFRPAVLKAWGALAGCVAADGRLTHVQPVGVDPKHFDENASDIFGVGAFLLAGSEVYRMVGGSR
jgi:rhamnogalacturonyl hydrolase YesR